MYIVAYQIRCFCQKVTYWVASIILVFTFVVGSDTRKTAIHGGLAVVDLDGSSAGLYLISRGLSQAKTTFFYIYSSISHVHVQCETEQDSGRDDIPLR